MSRVRRGYELTPHRANDLIQALCPHAVFPLELWHQTYEHFWKDYARAAAIRRKVECPVLPDVMLESGKFFHTDLCSFDVMAFFRKLSQHIDSKILKMGLEYILAETFDTFDTVYPEERYFLFSTLQKLEQRGADYNIYDIENIDDEVLFLPASSYHFISYIFSDTMLVDRGAAVRHLREFPLIHEMKGLTHAFVNSILNLPTEETQNQIISTPQPREQATPPRSTGSKKDSDRIKATRQASEEVAEELYKEKQLFDSDKANWKQSIIFDNGKTNWAAFMRNVETRLGSKAHYDTAREVWKSVPDNLKHKGRVREQ